MAGSFAWMSAPALMGQYERRIELIRQCANEARPAEFERKWLSVLTRAADWFCSLPLGPEVYREPAGAFRCAIETTFYALRLAGGQKFGTNLTSEKRRRIEPQYNHAVFLAAVCSALDEPYRHFEVIRVADGEYWNPAAHGALGPWLDGSAYDLRRRESALPVQRMRTGVLAQSLVGAGLLGALDAEVLSDLFGAINPLRDPVGGESLLHKVVREAVAVAGDFDRKAQRAVFEPVKFAVPSALDVAAVLQPAAAMPAGPVQGTPAAGGAGGKGTGTGTGAPSLPPASSAVTPSTDGASDAAKSVGAVPADAAAALAGASIGHRESGQGEGAPASAPAPADQLGLPFAAEEARPPALDLLGMRSGQPGVRATSADAPARADDVLEGAPNMIRDLFRALREDVLAGKAKVIWSDMGLVIQKRLIGNYGVTSETLVEHLRKRGLLLANGQGEITLAPRAGELIVARVPA
ncbi:TraI domain-containing protein [Paraburkholderia megapolitana]|uniref:TraI domain-containing protein n=1 Tax=Paraburkholderia megapolitana TaxID=420953 RepID=UPI0038BB81DE